MMTKAKTQSKNGTKEARNELQAHEQGQELEQAKQELERVKQELAQYQEVANDLARDKQNLSELVEYQRMRIAQHSH